MQSKKQPSNEKGPLYTSTISFGLPVLDFERVKMKIEAKKLGIKTNFLPEKYCFDSKTNSKIVITWKLGGEPCPFLSKDNRCKIYSSRPLICKHFPILMEGKRITYTKNCSAVKDEQTQKTLSDKKIIQQFFKKQVNALQKKLYTIERLNNVLGVLVKQNKVELLAGITEEKITKTNSFETTGLDEFFEEKELQELRSALIQ